MDLSEEKYVICAVCKTTISEVIADNDIPDEILFTNIEMTCNVNTSATRLSEASFCSKCRETAKISWDFYNNCRKNFPAVSNSSHPCQLNSKRICVEKSKDVSTQTGLSEYLIIVNQLPEKVSLAKLKDIFSKYGVLQRLHVMRGAPDIFAHIAYLYEDKISEISEQAERKEIKYCNEPLMITVVATDTTPIDALTDDCLRQVFEKIDNYWEKLALERVCKRWQRISRRSWSNIKSFNWDFTFISDCHRFDRVLIRSGAFLTSLELKMGNEPVHCLELVSKYCTNLKSIRFAFYSNTPSSTYLPHLKEIIGKSSHLQRVYLLRIGHDADDILKELPQTMREIRLFSSTTTMDVSKFRNLTALRLANVNLGDNSLTGIENVNNLEYLSFYKSIIHSSCIKKITHLTRLKVLKIANCQVDDITLSQIVQHNQMLHYLDISSNQDITDESFQYVAQLPNLKILIMNKVHRVTGLYLTKMRTLEKLCCDGCRSIRDLDLVVTIDSCKGLIYLKAGEIATERLIVSADQTVKLRYPRKPLSLYVDSYFHRSWRKFASERKSIKLLDNSDLYEYDFGNDVSDNEREWYSETP